MNADRRNTNGLYQYPKKIMGKSNKALWILIGYYLFEYVRPQDSYLPFLSPFSIPAMLVVAVFIILLRSEKKALKDGLIILVILFWLEMILSVPFANNKYHAYHTTKSVSMVFITVMATPLVINTKQDLLKFTHWWIVIVFLQAIWIIDHGGVGTGGFVKDENDACLLMIVGLPFAWFMFLHESKNKIRKLFYLISTILALIAIVATSSRGGFIGFMAVAFMLLLWSKRPVKNILVIIFLILFGGGVIASLLPSEYLEDIQSISDTEDSTRNLRFLHWTTAWEMYKDNPILGVGVNNYPWNSNRYFHLSPYYAESARGRAGRQSHSIYFTLIPELGTFGIILFVCINVGGYKRISRIKKIMSEDDICHVFAKSTGVAVVGFLVAGAFVSALYYPISWHLVAFVIAVTKISDREIEKNTASDLEPIQINMLRTARIPRQIYKPK